MTKVKLIIEHNTLMGEKVSSLMSAFDLGIGRVSPDPMIIDFTTKSKVDDKYKKNLIKKMKKHFEGSIVIYDIKIYVEK